MKVFVFNGMARSGKTSFENELENIIRSSISNQEPIICSIIDYVKDIASYAGWDGSKTVADRKFLAKLKNLLTEWNDSPFEEIIGLIEDCDYLNTKKEPRDRKDYILMIDMRQPEDIERLKMYCFRNSIPFNSVLVRRHDVEGESYGNRADDGVFDYIYDIIVENNGTYDELMETAKTFYKEYII
mgnify:CR=1 FL=1